MNDSIIIADCPSIRTNKVVYDPHRGEGILFLSAFGAADTIKLCAKALNKASRNGISFRNRYYRIEDDQYEIYTAKVEHSDYTHMIAYKKDYLDDAQPDNPRMHNYIFIESESALTLSGATLRNEAVVDQVFRKLTKTCPLPILKEWVPYLLTQMLHSYCIFGSSSVTSDNENKVINCFFYSVTNGQLRSFISGGLKNGDIFIGSMDTKTSETMANISTLDMYLNVFSDTLARRIQNSFIPRFTPGKDIYREELLNLASYEDYFNDCNPVDAQLSVIESVVRSMDEQKTSFIVADMGCGKTLMGIMSVAIHGRKTKGYKTNVIMCPSTLVNYWKTEIERFVPTTKAVVIEDFEHLMNTVPEVKNRKRNYNLWLVISKETAKLGYTERPQGIWKRKKCDDGVIRSTFCCPECNEPLYTMVKNGRGRYVTDEKVYFTETSFSKPYSKKDLANIECPHCQAKLWGVNTPYQKPALFENRNEKSEWVKLADPVGWIRRDHIRSVFNDLNNTSTLTAKQAQMLPVLSEAIAGKISPQVAPRKYPLGKFIRKHLKGFIDYAIIDEVHLLKGEDTLQGQAFGDIINTAKKSLCLTGTLINGMSSGIFYILYRAFPSLMKKEGFKYNDIGEFIRQYGVLQVTERFRTRGYSTNKIGASNTKELPGISPIVFTKFLLENAVFVGLEDMKFPLPSYDEIPVAIDMDQELTTEYARLTQAAKGTFGRSGMGMKTMSQTINLLTVYPDQPFDMVPVIHPDTHATIITPANLSKNTIRNKETELIKIVKERIAAGEKVIVYYDYTQMTELNKRLPKLMKDEGINAITLGNNVKSQEREEWINKQVTEKNIDVLICNPRLIETGLNLTAFASIIFYEVTYNLSTLRQASRRTWRPGQTKDIKVYFLYYKDTIQERAMSLMATKLQAAKAIEGKFSSEGLAAMSKNNDVLTQIAQSVSEGIKENVDVQVFSNKSHIESTFERKEKIVRDIERIRELHPIRFINDFGLNKKKRVYACGIDDHEFDLLNNFNYSAAAGY